MIILVPKELIIDYSYKRMKKRFYIMALALAMVASIAGCGKKKDDKETADSTAAIRDDIVEFVDVEFNDIRSDWDEAIADYNTFFEGDMKDSKQFASDFVFILVNNE